MTEATDFVSKKLKKWGFEDFINNFYRKCYKMCLTDVENCYISYYTTAINNLFNIAIMRNFFIIIHKHS